MISTREQILSQRQTKQQQMECYETNETDVPATTNVIHEKQMKTRTNEDVLTAELQPALAFEKFAGKIYQDNEAVARHRLVTLTSQRGTYESTPTTSSSLSRYQHFESPLDRYARLKNEIHEFHQDLKLLTNTKIDPVMADTATTISQNLESLSKELLSLLQDNRYQSILQSNNNVSAIPTTHSDLVQNLVTQLEAFTTETKVVAKPTTTTTTSTAPVTYELYYQPEKDTVAHHQQLNLVSLDRRLAAAEKWVGVNDGVTPLYPDLQSGINHLSTKLELLDQHKLEAVYRKVKGLMSELELLEQAKQQVQPNKQQIQEEKVNELYELMQRWDIAAQQLPIIVSRLQAVRDLHQESSTVIVRLQALEQQQSAITSLLQSDRDALQAVSTSLATNVKTMANNVATLEQRFKALEQKMSGKK